MRTKGGTTAGRPPGRDRSRTGPPSPRPGGQPGRDGTVRPVKLVNGRHALPAGPPSATPVLLAATEKLLAPILAHVQADELVGAGPTGVEVGEVISKYKTGKHFAVTITDATLAVTGRQDKIDAEAALGGFYVLRTPVPAAELDAHTVVSAYKNLKYARRDFRHIKADDLDLRPVFRRLEERVRAYVLACMLASYLT